MKVPCFITQHRAIVHNVRSNLELLKIEMETEFGPSMHGCEIDRTSQGSDCIRVREPACMHDGGELARKALLIHLLIQCFRQLEARFQQRTAREEKSMTSQSTQLSPSQQCPIMYL